MLGAGLRFSALQMSHAPTVGLAEALLCLITVGMNHAVESSPVVILAGAGASVPLGLPTVVSLKAELIKRLEEPYAAQLQDMYQAVKYRYRVGEPWVNIERVLEFLNEMRLGCWLLANNVIPASIHEQASKITSDTLLEAEGSLDALRKKVLSVIGEIYGAVDERQAEDLWGWLFDHLFQRQPVVPVFTMNYDWAIEEMTIGRRGEVRLVDGFPDARGGVFDCARFDLADVVKKPTIALFKLHGSTSWYDSGDRIIKSLAAPSADQTIAIRYPGARRDVEFGKDTFALEGLEERGFYSQWYETEPFDCLFTYLSETLADARLVVAIGYRFGDDEVNLRLQKALAQNKELQVLIMLPDPPASVGYLMELEFADFDDRFQFLSGRFGDADSNEELKEAITTAIAGFD